MSEEDERVKAMAKQWVRANRKKLIAKFCDLELAPNVKQPVTIFMAGTPGAGKTEFSVSLLEKFGGGFVRIDADEIRELMRDIGYNGVNAALFQDAANKGVNQLFDHANKKNGQNVLLDGTFAYGNWRENIDRSLAHNRTVEIYYLYQDPLVAWGFVQKRIREHGRVVPEDTFVKSYGKSIENVQCAKEIYGDKVTLYFAKNNYTKSVEYVAVDVDNIEKLLPKRYNDDELRKLIHASKDSELQS